MSVRSKENNKTWILTPGQTEKNANPSFSYSIAYCAVRLFRAALEILYAGFGIWANFRAFEMAPTLEPLQENPVNDNSPRPEHQVSLQVQDLLLSSLF